MRRRRRGAGAGSAAPASATRSRAATSARRSAAGSADRAPARRSGSSTESAGHALGAAAREHEREPPLVARVARAPDEAPAREVLDQDRGRRVGQGEVACHVAEGHAGRGGRDVVQELALVL